MPSPVTPAQFCEAVPTANADLCTRLTKFFNIGQLLCDLITWLLGSDGNFSETVITELALALRAPGEIAFSASPSMGSRWLLCDGSAVSRTTYANLFSAIGTRYGLGDGSTTFNIPDFRGRSPIGAGTGTDGSGGFLTNRNVNDKYVGEERHVQTETELFPHNHAFATTNGQQILTEVTSGKISTINRGGSMDYAHADPIQNTGGGVGFNVVHPCFICFVFIKI